MVTPPTPALAIPALGEGTGPAEMALISSETGCGNPTTRPFVPELGCLIGVIHEIR